MNEQNYTSLELSKKLSENGCGLDSEYHYEPTTNQYKDEWRLKKSENDFPKEFPYSYDILNDICVKYAQEMFPKYNRNASPKDGSESSSPNGKLQITREILLLLQLGKKQEAEEYIWEHCLFNPKNK